MSGGSLQLHEYSAEMVRIACDKCGRSGQYRKQNLIDWFGADIRLPDLRWEISHCDRLGKTHDACMVGYVDLIRGRKSALIFQRRSWPEGQYRSEAAGFKVGLERIVGQLGSAH